MLEQASIVSLSDLSYGVDGQRLVDAVSVSFRPDGVTVVMGPNGAGKSLLLRLISGLLEADSGSVKLSTQSDNAKTRVVLMAQKPVLLRRSVAANLDFALDIRGIARSDRPGRIDRLLELVGLDGLRSRPARLLSGGEQQRLSLARALAMQPDVLLLDEPTASLDPTATAQIERIVRQTADAGVKVVFVTHNRDQALRLADEVVFMHRGQVIEQSAADPFFHNPASREASDYLAGVLLQ